jgi:SAM-dependent methyltransferase
MSGYNDYGFYDLGEGHIHPYIVPKLLLLLDRRCRRILDMGCGNGALVRILLGQGYDAYGVDASESGIRLAEEKNPGRFALMDFSESRLPGLLDQQQFDAIVSTEVIEHLYDPVKFVARCRELLQPGGHLILSTPYHGYVKNLLIALAGRWDKHMDPLWGGGHIKLWTRRTLTALLAAQGFRVTGFKGCGRIPFLWKSMLIKAVRTDA